MYELFIKNFIAKIKNSLFFYIIIKRLLLLLILSSTLFAETEPNDTCANANLVNFNTQTNGSLRRNTPNQDRYDYYYFVAPTNGTVHITTSGFTGDMNGYLYNSNCSNELIKDNSDSANIDLTYNVSAGTTYKILLDAFSGNSTYTLNVTLSPTFSGNNYKNFSILYSENLRGDIRQIGNTILGRSSNGSTVCPGNTTNNADNNLITRYWDVDGDSSTVNSSSSNLEIPAGATIKKAYLYWQGRTTSTNSAKASQIKFKAPGNNYVTLTAPSANMRWDGSRDDYFPYQGSIEITNYMNGAGTYTVGDLTTYAGKYIDGLGAYGAWSMVIVYTKDNETLRNITIYDGYKTIATNNSENFTLSGFLTPSKGAVNSKFLIFTGEGDVDLKGDYVTMNGTRLTRFNDNSTNTNEYNTFSASITKDNAYVTTRTPACQNNLGIDIHTYDVGSTGLNIIKNSNTSASLTIGTNSDVYYLSVFAFATQLYEPRVCYYIDRISDDSNKTIFENRQFVNPIESGKNYTFDLWISNMKRAISDTDIETARLVQTYLNMTNMDYSENSTYIQNLGTSSKSFISDTPNNDIGEYDNNKSTWRLGIGATSLQGGTIEPASSFNDNSKKAFISLQSKFLTESNTTSLNLLDHFLFKASFQTDSITIGSDNAQLIEQCVDLNTTATIYQPPLGIFNVTNQNANVSAGDPQDGLDIKNALWSQISGKAFDVKIVSLANDKVTLKNFTGNVILDLVNSTSITDTQSTCTAAPVLQQYKSPTPKTNLFNNESTKNFNLQYDKAHQNSRFRIKFYDFSTIGAIEGQPCSVSNTSANINGVPQCFNDMNKVKKYFPQCATPTTNVCVSNLQEGDDDWRCYECIAGYNDPVCSRDNFAIRPMTYSIDLNETRLIGGKQYRFDLNATRYANPADDSNVSGYNQTITQDVDRNVSEGLKLPITCINPRLNENRRALTTAITFTEGRNTTARYTFNEIGDVNISVDDKLWTQVDRSLYNTKGFSDCIENDARSTANANGQIGCNISGGKIFHFFPQAFRNTLTLQDFHSANDGNFTYLSNDNNMTAHINIATTAILDDITPATDNDNPTAQNYTANCFARDINTSIALITLPANNEWLTNDSNATERINFFEDKVTTHSELNATGRSRLSTREGNFTDGIANIMINFNFDRNISTPEEPFHIAKNDFNITQIIDQNNTIGSDFNRTIDQNSTFYYGRVYSTNYRGQSPITTAIRYEVYCKNCAPMAFQAIGAQSPESLMWYQNPLHVTTDGNVTAFVAVGNSIIANPNTNTITNNTGLDTTHALSLPNGTNAPYTDRIQMRPTTSPWLLHNLSNPLATTNDFMVEFTQTGQWAGQGDLGRTVDVNASVRTNRRMEW